MLATGKKTVRAFLQELPEKERGYKDGRQYAISFKHTLYSAAALLDWLTHHTPEELDRVVLADWGDWGSTVCTVRRVTGYTDYGTGAGRFTHIDTEQEEWFHVRIVWTQPIP